MLSRARSNAVELFDFNGKRKCDFPQQGSLEKEEKDGGEAKQHIGRNVIDMYRSNAINVGRKSCTHKNA